MSGDHGVEGRPRILDRQKARRKLSRIRLLPPSMMLVGMALLATAVLTPTFCPTVSRRFQLGVLGAGTVVLAVGAVIFLQ